MHFREVPRTKQDPSTEPRLGALATPPRFYVWPLNGCGVERELMPDLEVLRALKPEVPGPGRDGPGGVKMPAKGEVSPQIMVRRHAE